MLQHTAGNPTPRPLPLSSGIPLDGDGVRGVTAFIQLFGFHLLFHLEQIFSVCFMVLSFNLVVHSGQMWCDVLGWSRGVQMLLLFS
jgi:hypothetical protein